MKGFTYQKHTVIMNENEKSKMHELKLHPQYYDRIVSRQKTFECRYNDRDFQVGDKLFLYGFNPQTKKNDGTFIVCNVTYLLIGLGLREGFCVMGIEVLEHGFDFNEKRESHE